MMDQFKKGLNYFYYGLVIFVFTTFFIHILLFKQNFSFDDGVCNDWGVNWNCTVNDETQVIDLPIDLKLKKSQQVIIEKKLPNDIRSYNCIMFRASQQDVAVYIDDILRTSYTDKNFRSFGNSSASRTMLIPLYDRDAGKTIKIRIVSAKKSFSGMLNNVYLATEKGALFNIMKKNLPNTILACLIMMVGILLGIGFFVLRVLMKRKSGIHYLALFSIQIASWMLYENKMSQFYIKDIIAASNICFLMVMLCAIPMLLYMNYIQDEKYERGYYPLISLMLFNTVMQCILQFMHIAEFYDMMIVSHILLIISFIYIIYTCINELKINRQRKNIETAIGVFGLAFLGLIDIIKCYFSVSANIGVFVGVGVFVLILMLGFSAMNEHLKAERKTKEAISANIAKSRFLAMMSHEIRTPIGTVLGMNEMILRESKEEAVKEYAGNIETAGKLLLSIINDILDFSKIESGKMEIISVVYDMKTLLMDLNQMIQQRAKKKELRFSMNVDPDMPSVYQGDEIRIKQIITNLLTNAVKYTEKGSVELNITSKEIEPEVAELYVSVNDTGIGIKNEDMVKLFTSFKRLDYERNRNVEGTGLGLAITKHLLNLMGSDLEVVSEYGKGSSFSFRLIQQIKDHKPIGHDLYDEKKSQKRGMGFVAPGVRILAVDDNRMNLTVLKGLLKDTQLMIDTVNSGKAALEAVQKNEYSIILLDHMMPEMDGIETLLKMKELNQNLSADAKVIAVTANAISGVREKYLSKGFDDYITKPINPMELKNIILNSLPPNMYTLTDLQNPEQKKAGFLNTERIDEKKGLDYCNGDSAVYHDILKEYLKKGEKLLADIQDEGVLFDEADLKGFEIKAHSLKSSSLTIGADELAEEAKKMEFAAQENNMEYIRENSARVRTLYKAVLEDIKLYLGNNKNIDLYSNAKYSDKIHKKLIEMKEAMENFEYEHAEKLLNQVLKENDE